MKSIVFSIFMLLLFIALSYLEIFWFIKFQSIKVGLSDELCECKTLNSTKSRILNGDLVGKDELQWTASIFHELKNGSNILAIKHVCTATVINDRFLLSTGQCGLPSQSSELNVNNYNAAAGLGGNMTKAYFNQTNRRKIKNIFVHPSFKFRKRTKKNQIQYLPNDISIFELEQPFVLGFDIYPACLLEEDKNEFEDDFIVAGYGDRILRKILLEIFEFTVPNSSVTTIDLDGHKINIIKKDQLMMTSYKQSSNCSNYLSRFNNSIQICAIAHNSSRILKGDSGSALLYPISNKLFVAGIASESTIDYENLILVDKFPKSITEIEYTAPMSPDIFTRVHFYLDWIDQYVGHNRCLLNRTIFKFDLEKSIIFASIFILSTFVFYLQFRFLNNCFKNKS